MQTSTSCRRFGKKPFITVAAPLFALLSPDLSLAGSGKEQEENTNISTSLDGMTITAAELNIVGNSLTEAGAGFQTFEAELGMLGNRDLLDTPMEVWTISNDMLRNNQARTLPDIMKYMPSTQIQSRGGMEIGRPMNRGFEGNPVSNSRLDGFNTSITTSVPMESVERLDVIHGLTGSLFGPGAPAGSFNFVHKRPTRDFMFNVEGTFNDDSRWKGHADISDTVGPGDFFGYRLNLVKDDGDGNMGNGHIRRSLLDVALDFHLHERVVLEFNASHYENQMTGGPATFLYNDSIDLPDAPDGEDTDFGPRFASVNINSDTGSFRIKYQINDDWNMVAGVGRQIADRFQYNAYNRLTDNEGNYTSLINANRAYSRFVVNSNQFRINGKMKTGPLQHQLTFGTTGFTWDTYSIQTLPSNTNQILGYANINNPISYSKISLFKAQDSYRQSTQSYQAVTIGDSITWGKWTASAMLTKSWIESKSYNRDSMRTSDSNDHGTSRSYSLSYKPIPNMTAYIAWADSLEIGGTAPSGAVNEGQTTSPYRSEQWEAGLKYRLGTLDLGMTFFNARRPYAYTDEDNYYRVMGEQVNRGMEFSAQGEVLPGLGIYGGVTWLDPILKDAPYEETDNKRMVSIPRTQANFLVEYAVPKVNGLVLSTNLHYTSRRAANQTNTSWADSYHTVDIGARYSTQIFGHNFVWRATIDNVTNKHYWASIFVNSINGDGSSNNATLGELRTIRTSISLDL